MLVDPASLPDPSSLDSDTATQVVGRILGESGESLETLRRCVESLGASRCFDILRQVLRVEQAGGVPTADESRRKTPGGVFLAIVKDAVDKDTYRSLCCHIKENARAKVLERRKEIEEVRNRILGNTSKNN
jgi:hypothetical protein